jgi:hypothetical protein
MVAMELLVQLTPVVEWLQLPPDLFSRLTKAVNLTAIIFHTRHQLACKRLEPKQ